MTDKPKRIQMHRRKGGWRKDHPDAVIVSRPSKWGNPYKIGDTAVPDAETATRKFQSYCTDIEDDQLEELRGKDLACWCPIGSPCHADVLLRWANE